MKQSFSSQPAHLLKRGYCVALVAGLLTVVLAFSAFSFAASAHAVVSRSATLTSVNALVDQNLGQFVEKAPNVHAETLTLPAASCTALQKTHLGANCHLFSYATVTIHAILPQGRLAAAVPATWYTWSSSSWVCSVVGCWYWGLHLQANGVLNYGISIWQWNVFCNARGLANCTWHGYFGNGTSTIQIGLDGNACIAYCASHGIRKSINDKGAQVSYYTW